MRIMMRVLCIKSRRQGLVSLETFLTARYHLFSACFWLVFLFIICARNSERIWYNKCWMFPNASKFVSIIGSSRPIGMQGKVWTQVASLYESILCRLENDLHFIDRFLVIFEFLFKLVALFKSTCWRSRTNSDKDIIDKEKGAAHCDCVLWAVANILRD